MSNEESETERYVKQHICNVRKYLSYFSRIVYNRGVEHDQSKLMEPELSLWKKMDEEPRYPYSIDPNSEYQKKLERHKTVFELHWRNNRHHPEHFHGWYTEMDLVDLIEFMCDNISYKQNLTFEECERLIKDQCARYNFPDILQNILLNTLSNHFIRASVFKDVLDTKEEIEKEGKIIDVYA